MENKEIVYRYAQIKEEIEHMISVSVESALDKIITEYGVTPSSIKIDMDSDKEKKALRGKIP